MAPSTSSKTVPRLRGNFENMQPSPRFILVCQPHWFRCLTSNSRQQKIPSTSCSKYAKNNQVAIHTLLFLLRAQQGRGLCRYVDTITQGSSSAYAELNIMLPYRATSQYQRACIPSGLIVACNCSKSHGASSIISASSQAFFAYDISVGGNRTCRT